MSAFDPNAECRYCGCLGAYLLDGKYICPRCYNPGLDSHCEECEIPGDDE